MLRDVRCPVLFLNGRYDQFRLGIAAYRRACPHAEEVVVPGAAHVVNLDQPERFADAVLGFVERVSRTAP
jgi:pimeloyl-ACP methyl ester carboxylesterase